MRKVDLITSGVMIFGLFLLSLGLILYSKRLLNEFNAPWEAYLSLVGFFILLLALASAKILERIT